MKSLRFKSGANSINAVSFSSWYHDRIRIPLSGWYWKFSDRLSTIIILAKSRPIRERSYANKVMIYIIPWWSRPHSGPCVICKIGGWSAFFDQVGQGFNLHTGKWVISKSVVLLLKSPQWRSWFHSIVTSGKGRSKGKVSPGMCSQRGPDLGCPYSA